MSVTSTAKKFNYRGILLAETRGGPVNQSDILDRYPGMSVTELRGAAHQLKSEGDLIVTEFLPPAGTTYSRRERA